MARGINFLSFSFMIEGDIMLVGMKELKIEKANVLMVYDNVLKSPDPYILNSIRKNYREEFKDFMDLDLLDSLGDYESLFYLTMCRRNLRRCIMIQNLCFSLKHSRTSQELT